MLLSEPKTLRAQAVRQALSAYQRRTTPSTTELAILTQYVLGHLNLEQVNAQLRQYGRTILAAPLAS